MVFLENLSSMSHYASFKIIFSIMILKCLLVSGFLHMTPKAQVALSLKSKDKLDFIKIKNFCASKDTVKKVKRRDFPGGPVVKTPHFHCRGRVFEPWSGN